MPYVYVLRCSDHSLYIGHTHDLGSRERVHNEGHGSLYTSLRRPVSVVYFEEYASTRAAIARERQLKRWSAQKKEALIAGNLDTIKALAKRRVK